MFGHIEDPVYLPTQSECDFYGASRLIADEGCNEKLRGFWYHGWGHNPCNFIEQYRWHEAPETWPLLVNTSTEAAKLKQLGARNVHAVGAPILYCPKQIVTRLPNSILIMPFHTLEQLRIPYEEERYFAMLDEKLSLFDYVGACLHPACLQQGRWVRRLSARKIPFICGTSTDDAKGLIRMAQLLGRFTHVTSNWLGSHIAYAGFHGCAVSIFGPRPHFTHEMFNQHPYYQAYPHILDWFIAIENSGYAESRYGFLFASPEKARPCVQWAREQLGHPNMRPKPEVAKLLTPATGNGNRFKPKLKQSLLGLRNSLSLMRRRLVSDSKSERDINKAQTES